MRINTLEFHGLTLILFIKVCEINSARDLVQIRGTTVSPNLEIPKGIGNLYNLYFDLD